ncbi:hypothetical protein G6F57_005662 [Rhizopus arrhizus]|nr:hypothetical protein G6F30_002946 [Rhizopus arrhizus]KAG1416472.1 hypothetical protein G6F58_005956 [Rhizopus delemar]KAG0986637.1 hypothetical protein G6F29_003123 [Rhizopus arrhizus]KAG0997803.1 hypothetical protein G6F28_002544 [Rhizopus arrhizus]KAG1011977.1 hypothetical protein G6F27_003259 [Rhizopus arrhizus]
METISPTYDHLYDKRKHQGVNNSDLITPPISPVSPVNSSLVSNRQSLKVTAGQTGLPWLSKDAEGDQLCPQAQSSSTPPPKFTAKPNLSSVIGLPTRKRTNQKHVYCMKDGIDPVKILCRRLKSWQLSVKYLMSLFKRIKKVEIKNGKGYRKIDTNFAIPSKIQDQFKSSNGVQDAWAAFRQFTRENSLIHQDFVDFIENEMIPSLNVMLKDIHHFMHSLLHNKALYTGNLYSYRKKADKMITKLNNEIYKVTRDQEDSIKNGKGLYVIPKRDPLLTKYMVMNTIVNLYKHENRLHKDFLAAQDNYRQFEQEKIINVYTKLFQTFENYRTTHGLERSEGVSKIVNIFNEIESDSEWLEFLHHHQNELVKSTAAFKDEHVHDFPNASHPLVQPLITDDLKRKIGSSKWHNEYYVLSPVGLLYCFKSETDFHHRPYQPNFSTFVPKSETLINPTNQLLDFKGKTLGLLGRKKHLELTATNSQDIERWADIMASMTISQPRQSAAVNDISHKENLVNEPNMTAASDVPAASLSMQVEEPAVIQTDGLQDKEIKQEQVLKQEHDDQRIQSLEEKDKVKEQALDDDSLEETGKAKEGPNLNGDHTLNSKLPKGISMERQEGDVFYDTVA